MLAGADALRDAGAERRHSRAIARSQRVAVGAEGAVVDMLRWLCVGSQAVDARMRPSGGAG